MALLPPNFRERLRAVRLFQPLVRRDFALLTTGSVVSLLGDGFFSIALAWQVYEISNVPTALSIVGVAWTVPLIAFLLLGGVFTDRYDRRRLMIGADIIRAAAIGLLGILSLYGVIELWHVIVLIAFVGLGDAFFNPAATAIVPDLLPDELLPQANALNGLIRPLTIRLIGPARRRLRRRTLQRRHRVPHRRGELRLSRPWPLRPSAARRLARSFPTACARPSRR